MSLYRVESVELAFFGVFLRFVINQPPITLRIYSRLLRAILGVELVTVEMTRRGSGTRFAAM